jgi:hypothetical protein
MQVLSLVLVLWILNKQRFMLHFRRATFAQQLKSRVGLVLAKAATLRITLNLDGESITSKSHSSGLVFDSRFIELYRFIINNKQVTSQRRRVFL